MVNATLDSEVEALRRNNGSIRGWARWASAGGGTRSARGTGAAACGHISCVRVDVQGEAVAGTTVLQSVVRASVTAIARGCDLRGCVDGVAAVTFGRVLSAEVLVARAEVGTVVQSHEVARRGFTTESTRARVSVAVGVSELANSLRRARRSQDIRRTIGEDRKTLVVATNLGAVASASRGARVLDDFLGSVFHLVATEALRSKLKASNLVTLRHASVRAHLDGVGAVVVSQDGESASGAGVGPAATVGHVAGVGVVVHRRGCGVEAGVWEWIVAVLKSRVTEVIRAVAVAVEVVCEQTGDTSGIGHHSTSIVAHVDKIHSVAVSGCWVAARGREGLDEVEETLVTISTSCEGRAGRRVIALVLCATGIGNLFALVVGDDGLTSRGYKTLAVGH